MKKIFLLKRGVSPLIATVLLISFAVALGAVVMNWGRSIDMSSSDDKCSGVEMMIRATGYEVCYGGSGRDSYINFILDNGGSVDIDGLGIWIVGAKGTKFHDFDNIKIAKGQILDIKDQTVSYDLNTYGNINHVQFIPKVLQREGSIDICPKSAIKAVEVERCQ